MAVLNKYHHGNRVPDGAVDIMRGTAFGNPYPIGPGCTREDALALFRSYLWTRLKTEPDFRAQVAALHGRDVCCCCAPAACHGDILLRAAAWLTSQPVTPQCAP